MNVVVEKIERIKSVFLNAQLFYSANNNMDQLVEYLEKTDKEFRSIAYESASMSIALTDLETDKELGSWLFFSRVPALTHKAQVYIGLGWAIAKLNLPFLSVVEKTESKLYHRIADGCGYYDGSFRHRPTVLSQQLPIYLPETALPMYDQGVGRSLWYSSNADIDKIRNKVESFPANRRTNLWRGVGIAVAYVGGFNEDSLSKLMEYAGVDRVQLACGAALAAKSRMEANTMTNDTDQCSRFWYLHTVIEPNAFPVNNSVTAIIGDEAAYFNWIIQIEERLANSFEK